MYLGLAWHFWNTRWRRVSAVAKAIPGEGGLASWERAAILVPLVLHAALVYARIFEADQLRFGWAQALSVMSLLAVALYWIESLFYRLDGMEPLVLPFAAVSVPLPALFPGLASSALYSQALAFKLHLAQRVLDVRFGEARFAAHRLDDLGEPPGQGIQHRSAKLNRCPTL